MIERVCSVMSEDGPESMAPAAVRVVAVLMIIAVWVITAAAQGV